MKIILLITFFFIQIIANESFSQSKKELRKIYQNHQITFYCECKYNYKNKNNMIDKRSCGYQPRNPYSRSGKPNTRIHRIEWEHIMPAENFGRQLQCWHKGDPKCINKKGNSYKGRKCCEKVSKQFRIMQADMHNLVPAIGELNGDRSNYRYDYETAQSGQYGQCRFEVDFKGKRAYIKEDIRGDVARAYLYMSKQYCMKLSKQDMQRFEVWHKADPAVVFKILCQHRVIPKIIS